MTRKNGHGPQRRPVAVHLGRLRDLVPEDVVDVIVTATYSAFVRSGARREALAVPAGVYWPTVAVALSVAEIRALLDALPDPALNGLGPLRAELVDIVEAAEATPT